MKPEESKIYNLLVGGYTGEDKGISVYHFNTETGQLTFAGQSGGISNPSYLCVAQDGKVVYAVSEKEDAEAGAFSFEPKTGKLVLINKQSTHGAAACYVSVDANRKHLFIANYGSGSLAVLPLNPDGSILPASQVIHDTGSSIDPDRQEGPHVHAAVLSPDEKYLLHADLGTDKVYISSYNSLQAQPLTPASPSFVNVIEGSGPRHIEFSPDKKYLYLVHELTGIITGFNYSAGTLTQIQTITMLADGFSGEVAAADIHVSPDGKFLYASNRGDANEIVVYAITPETGMLTLVERVPAGGKEPRNFVIDPTGNFLLAANQGSDNIHVFKINKTTGRLTSTGINIDAEKPSCLKFI